MAQNICNIIKAEKTHKQAVLKLLDDFRAECHRLINPHEKFSATSAQDKGGPLFEHVVISPASAIFLAEEGGKYIGIATVNSLPQVRHGRYIAEVEEMFVYPKCQGTGVAIKLMAAVEKWAKENGMTHIRLESGNELERAHGFYEKAGFRFYAKAYEKMIG